MQTRLLYYLINKNHFNYSIADIVILVAVLKEILIIIIIIIIIIFIIIYGSFFFIVGNVNQTCILFKLTLSFK